MASRIEKRPPISDAPPITTARIASNSNHKPALLASEPRISAAAIIPASAAQTAATQYTLILMAFSFKPM